MGSNSSLMQQDRYRLDYSHIITEEEEEKFRNCPEWQQQRDPRRRDNHRKRRKKRLDLKLEEAKPKTKKQILDEQYRLANLAQKPEEEEGDTYHNTTKSGTEPHGVESNPVKLKNKKKDERTDEHEDNKSNIWLIDAMKNPRSQRTQMTLAPGILKNKTSPLMETSGESEDFMGCDGSDIETDNEFDSVDGREVLDNDLSSDVSSENYIDHGMDDESLYERSCRMYSENENTGEHSIIDDKDIFLRGLDLCPEYIDHFRFQRKDNFYRRQLSMQELSAACKENPRKFKRCTIDIESSHNAIAIVIDPHDDVKEIEIPGRSKCGHDIFTDDEVVVEILKQERPEGKDIIPRLNKDYAEKLKEVKSYGKVIGRFGRSRFNGVKHPLFVCVLDDFQMNLMKPLCRTIPKLHILNKKTENSYEVEVYDYDSTSGKLRYNKKELINPADRKAYIFFVAFLKWDTNMIYPLGAVVDILTSKGGISSGMTILRLQHQVPYLYSYSTVQSVQSMHVEPPVELTEGRVDLTDVTTFTVDPPTSRDLDDALSIEKIKDEVFRVGVHIADVSTYINKGDHIDREARERAVTFYSGQGYKPYHMIPEPLSQNLCSLVQGKRRLALSIFFHFDSNGKQIGRPEIKKTMIKSDKQFTYKEVQHIIMEKSDCCHAKLSSDIRLLYTIAKQMRQKRLGNAMFALPVEVYQLENEESILDTLEAHYLVEEFMVLANHTVALCLINRYPNCVPLRCQNSPNKDDVQKWLTTNKNIADMVLHLQGIHPLEHRRLDVKNVPPQRYTRVSMLQESVWKKLGKAVNAENLRDAWKVIGCDEIHPRQAIAYIEWIKFQETASYRCSGILKEQRKEGRHFSLGIFPYCHFTSPIRRYTDVIVHRLLHAALENKPSPYTTEEVCDLCTNVNAASKRAKSYEKQCQSLIWGHKLKKKPLMFYGFANELTEQAITFHIPGMRRLQKNCKELPCNLLNLCSRPSMKKDVDSNEDILELRWQSRVYSHTGYSPRTAGQNLMCRRIDPHQRARFIHTSSWIQILNALFEGNLKTLQHALAIDMYEQEVLKEYVPQCRSTVKDVTSEVRGGNIIKQYSDFSLSVCRGQILGIQITSEPTKGILVPVPQLLDLSRSVKCCLLHVKDPVSQFASYSTVCSKQKYSSTTEYRKIWSPLVAMEAAVSAVRGDSAFINDLPVKFEAEGGRFTLKIPFCEQRNIDFNSMSMDFMMKDDDEDEEVQYMASSDHLCIRCIVDSDENPVRPEHYSKALDDGGKVWIGHASVDKIKKRKKKEKIDVHFQLHGNSPKPLSTFVASEWNPYCCVEVLQKPEDMRRTEAILKWLDNATPLAKAIALGRGCPKLDKDHLDLARKIEGDLIIKGIAKNNVQQDKAIQKALISTFSIIQGPPGTGKTYTGIKLLYLFNKINKIWNEEGNKRMQTLFCGPSNKSVDLVAKWMLRKLGELSPKIVRLYGNSLEQVEFPVPGRGFSASRTSRDAKPDPELGNISMHHLIRQDEKPHAEKIKSFDKKFKADPNFSDFEQIKDYLSTLSQAVQEELKHYEIIFCTTSMAANPKFLKGTKGRIYQVIVDECGMCTEPESMVPIVATQAKQVVLIGDHKQLRPVVLCKDAANLGLEKSLFERYAEYATFLNIQYRMNPRICDFPSKMFYEGKLQTAPSYAWETTPLTLWPYPNIPHVFCHIEGVENKLPVATEEGNEKSCMNEEEVQQVIKVYKHLVNREKVDPHYINVISQYNAQCCALRDSLKKEGYNNANVNTVVSSQGGEWDYVIFSTVRSLPDYKIEPNPTLGWCKENLGFITDEHQVNVALTRSKKGLIIIGNKDLLKCHKVWKALLEHYDQSSCIVEAKNFPKPQKRIKKRHHRSYELDIDDNLE